MRTPFGWAVLLLGKSSRSQCHMHAQKCLQRCVCAQSEVQAIQPNAHRLGNRVKCTTGHSSVENSRGELYVWDGDIVSLYKAGRERELICTTCKVKLLPVWVSVHTYVFDVH